MKSQSSINKDIIGIIKVTNTIMLTLTFQSNFIHGTFNIVVVVVVVVVVIIIIIINH